MPPPPAVKPPSWRALRARNCCSFCHKDDTQVEQLVAGPEGIYICNACVVACMRTITVARALRRAEQDEDILLDQRPSA